MKHRWGRIVVLLAGLILPQAILIGPSLTGRKILLPLDLLRLPSTYLPPRYTTPAQMPDLASSDLVLQLEPNRRFASEQVRSGRLPLWNPYSYCGAPFLASNQPAIFSPFRVIDYLWPGPLAIAWGRLIRVLVAGVGAYLFFRRALRLRFLSAAIGAWCYPLGGFLTLWAGYLQEWEVTWFPLLLAATDAAIRRPRACTIIGLSVVTACVLVSGHSATGVQMLLADGAFALWAIFRRYGTRAFTPGRGLRATIAIGAGWLIGILLSLPQTLPTLDYMQRSARIAARKAGFVETPPQGLGALPQLVLPHFFGVSSGESIYLGRGNRLESAASGYAGLIVTMILAPLGWLSRRHRPALLFLGIAAVFGVGQVLDLPLLSAWYCSPPFNTLRNNRLVFVTGFALLACAAVGLDALLRGRRPRQWWWALLAAPLLLGFFCLSRRDMPVGLKLAVAVRGPEIAKRIDSIADWFHDMHMQGAAWCAIAIVTLMLAMKWQGRRAILVGVIGAFCIVELIASARNISAQSDPAYYYPRLAVLDELAQRPAGRMCSVRCLPAALNLIYPLPDVRGYDSADPILLTQILDRIRDPGAPAWSYARTQYFFPGGELPLLDLLNLRYLVHAAPLEGVPVAWQGDGFLFVERPSADTRVFVPRTVQVIPDAPARLTRMTQLDWNPRQELILESNPPGAVDPISGTARIVREEPSRVEIEASMQTAGFVLLADQWDPGWKATVNGSPAPVLRADHAFRAVQVPAGQSSIVFVYAPASFRWGLIGGACGVVAIVAMIVATAVRRRRAAGARS